MRSAKTYRLRLYVLGMTGTAQRALDNLRRLCEERLKGQYHIEVIDVQQNLQLAEDEQIFAIPTVERRLPAPIRRIIGDLSEQEKLVVGLDLIQL